MVVGVIMNIIENGRYIRVMEAQNGVVAPEERLRMCAIGGCLLPIGLAWFAASTSPSVHWIVPIIGELHIPAAPPAPLSCPSPFFLIETI